MRTILRPANLGVLPMGTSLGANATANTFVANGYTWQASGNRTDPFRVFNAGEPAYEQDVNGWLNDLTGYFQLRLPLPLILTGCEFSFPASIGNNGDAGAQLRFEGLDRSTDPNGVWRTLLAAIQINSGSLSGGTANAVFTLNVPVEELRISSAQGGNPSYPLAKGFRFGKIRSLY